MCYIYDGMNDYYTCYISCANPACKCLIRLIIDRLRIMDPPLALCNHPHDCDAHSGTQTAQIHNNNNDNPLEAWVIVHVFIVSRL